MQVSVWWHGVLWISTLFSAHGTPSLSDYHTHMPRPTRARQRTERDSAAAAVQHSLTRATQQPSEHTLPHTAAFQEDPRPRALQPPYVYM